MQFVVFISTWWTLYCSALSGGRTKQSNELQISPLKSLTTCPAVVSRNNLCDSILDDHLVPPCEWGTVTVSYSNSLLSGECMFTHVIKPVSVWLCLTTHNLLLHQRLSVCSLRWMKCKFWALTCGVGKIVGVSKSKLHFERIQPTASRATQHQPRHSCCRSAGRYVSSYCATFNKLS